MPASVFGAERWGDQRWRIRVPAAQYAVELLFAEKYAGVTRRGRRTFSVRTDDTTTVEPALDVLARAGGRTRALAVRARVRSREYVPVELRGVRGNAFLTGIRVISRRPQASLVLS